MSKFFLSLSLCASCFLGTLQADEPAYAPRDFSALLEMPGWNQDLLRMHFTLYQGYVKHTNVLLEEMAHLNATGKNRSYEFGALKRRFGWEFDGMRLHELYFENLTKERSQGKAEGSLLRQIEKDFGSFDAWQQDFIATGLMRGIGWAILYRDRQNGRLCNVWINEHDVGHLALGEPLLVMDVFEHAYITQFGLDRSKYIDLFFQSLNWPLVNKRFLAAETQSFSHLKGDQNNDKKGH